MSNPVTALGIRTGSIETGRRVRHSVVFDLSGIAPNQTVVSAKLHLHHPAAGAVILQDPSGQAHYGFSRRQPSPDRAIRLTAIALEDLRKARGSFFWVETTERLVNRDPSSVAADARCSLDLVIVAASREPIVRREPDHAAA